LPTLLTQKEDQRNLSLGEYLGTFADDPAGEVSGNKYFGRVLASFPIHPQQYQQYLEAQGHKWYGPPPQKN
jgi:hypothetical protein